MILTTYVKVVHSGRWSIILHNYYIFFNGSFYILLVFIMLFLCKYLLDISLLIFIFFHLIL